MVGKMQTCIPDNVADNQITCLDHIIVRKQSNRIDEKKIQEQFFGCESSLISRNVH